LFTATGKSEPLAQDDLIGPALAAEDVFKATALTVSTAPTIRSLADLNPNTLALMHGSAYNGECSKQLVELADGYEQLFEAARAS
jgi:hypothetical protein